MEDLSERKKFHVQVSFSSFTGGLCPGGSSLWTLHVPSGKHFEEVRQHSLHLFLSLSVSFCVLLGRVRKTFPQLNLSVCGGGGCGDVSAPRWISVCACRFFLLFLVFPVCARGSRCLHTHRHVALPLRLSLRAGSRHVCVPDSDRVPEKILGAAARVPPVPIPNERSLCIVCPTLSLR